MNDKEQVINYLRERGLEPTQEDVNFFCGKARDSFAWGVVWSCARINEFHDQPTIANFVLNEADLSYGELELMPKYDLDFLRGENPSLPTGKE